MGNSITKLFMVEYWWNKKKKRNKKDILVYFEFQVSMFVTFDQGSE